MVKEMMLFDHETFYKQFRMSTSRYKTLLQMIVLLIIKSSMRRYSYLEIYMRLNTVLHLESKAIAELNRLYSNGLLVIKSIFKSDFAMV